MASQSQAMTDLLERARSLLPDYTTCRRCHRPLWGPLSVQRGIGPACELREAVERFERAPDYSGQTLEFRGQMRRVK